ncbi:glycerophosphodiester phosphodiesterase [Opitutus sp. ER46]|uniref:glycerophosphodiester phosphodiesterase n=1 Tax=Opitutus sp. ER46 TaxID=2161864 RepID=UPI000D30D5D9|nr:glycerophosphodiester phosphodiesterase [Opitutus sp. ER46]PTX94457.1 glycerophosphodiester phosphodiesterase [Opitutus sp. ER46]
MKKHLVLFLALMSAAATVAAARPLVIAHRGASGYLPEHTLPAKALAHGLGADFIEQDVVLSQDGVPVVLHDIEIDNVTDVAKRFPDRHRANGRFYAIDFTLAELKQLRVTERFDVKTGERVFPGRFPAGRSTFSISTLEEELQLIQGLNQSTGRVAGIYPELKAPAWHREQGQDISAIVLPILARYGYRTKADPFFLQCFEFAEVKRLRTELGFAGRMVLLVGKYGEGAKPEDNGKLLTAAALDEVAKYADGIGPALALLVTVDSDGKARPNDVVRLAHERKLVVHPYTFRSDALPKFCATPEAFFDLFFNEVGIDGLFSDFPDAPFVYLAKHAHAGR